MDFVQPHHDVQLSLLVPRASDVDGLADLSGRRLAVQEDSTAESFALREVPPGTEIDVLAGDQYMFDALREGRVDGVLQELSLNLAHTEQRKFTIVELHPTGEQYAFAVPREADELRRALDRRLAQLRQDGSYDALREDYFAVG
jgi:polar amino acid transport system substrate-binding protein